MWLYTQQTLVNGDISLILPTVNCTFVVSPINITFAKHVCLSFVFPKAYCVVQLTANHDMITEFKVGRSESDRTRIGLCWHSCSASKILSFFSFIEEIIAYFICVLCWLYMDPRGHIGLVLELGSGLEFALESLFFRTRRSTRTWTLVTRLNSLTEIN